MEATSYTHTTHTQPFDVYLGLVECIVVVVVGAAVVVGERASLLFLP